ncbi:isocitrate lyase/phosphoenolpyruvate mutase family protein [Castellaniella sp.]|uniref:isocitrate lyase/PEP mutase family protein n=1 Tax=Castellaniella sp. TaxID=1955812 RepID=UPI002AFED9A6|nr:isocitrate lyase/phosphoenolpyruvate mutase family protein [Castellaniella sp.]
MPTLSQKAQAFHALHHTDRAFIIPNPWDIGTARLLAGMGFQALATTSAGYAYTLGVSDYHVTRDQMLAHVAELAAATDLPVSADMEAGYADTLDGVAETYRLTAQTGAVGASIEDATGRDDDPIYDLAEAVDRVRAAVEAVRSLPYAFTLTARAENHLHGRTDLKDTIRRLQAYQEAGADVLYAPGLRTREDITAVVSSVDLPVNVLMGSPGMNFSVDDLSGMGVKRISVGSALSRAAWGAFLRASREMLEHGAFTFGEDAVSYADIAQMLSKK